MVPLFGAALALVAIRHIALSDGVVVGRGAALVGLALCVASFAAAASRTWSVEYLRTKQAAATGTRWVELLCTGHMLQAYNMTIQSIEPANRHEQEGPAENSLDPVAEFAANPAVEALLDVGASAKVQFAGNLSYAPSSGGLCVIEQRYVVTPSGDRADHTPIAVKLRIQRGYRPGVPLLQWLVASYQRDDQADAASPAG